MDFGQDLQCRLSHVYGRALRFEFMNVRLELFAVGVDAHLVKLLVSHDLGSEPRKISFVADHREVFFAPLAIFRQRLYKGLFSDRPHRRHHLLRSFGQRHPVEVRVSGVGGLDVVSGLGVGLFQTYRHRSDLPVRCVAQPRVKVDLLNNFGGQNIGVEPGKWVGDVSDATNAIEDWEKLPDRAGVHVPDILSVGRVTELRFGNQATLVLQVVFFA